MDNDRYTTARPSLIANVVTDQNHHIDNLFTDTQKKLKINILIKKSGVIKRSCVNINEVVFLLLLGKWVNG